uniref:Uncharacterized protein n=1 Tax=Oryza barthii TaxID=65489 RepID=A0A0D3GIA7_9ORYZ
MEKSPPPAPHFLFVVSGIQGHINPARRLAARLMASAPAARVTFSTAVSAHRLMFPSLPSPAGEDVDDTGVAYVPHSDGYDDGYKPGAAAFAVYYHYFHGHGEALASCANDPARGAVVRLPGMPLLRSDELPSAVSIVSPEHKHYLLLAMLRDLFEDLDELKPRVLVNTFDALEPDALRAAVAAGGSSERNLRAFASGAVTQAVCSSR